MCTPKEIAAIIGDMFSLPRAYAFGASGKWVRVHDLLDRDRLAYFYETGTPVCVAMRRPSGDDLYAKLHDFVVFDVDAVDDKSAKFVAGQVCSALSAENVPYLCTFSGKKGYHMFVFLKTPTAVSAIDAWQKRFMSKYCLSEKATTEFPANIDTQISLGPGKGKIIKLPFSSHQEIPSAQDIPIRDPRDFVMAGRADIEDAFKIVGEVERWDVPATFADAPKCVAVENGKSLRKRLAVTKKTGDGSKSFMMKLVNAVPCLRTAYDKLKSGAKGGFWERVAICTTFAQCGVSKEDAESFFIDEINDDEDNRTGKLSYYVNYCYEKKNWSSCAIFQDRDSHTPLCVRPCGREAPYHDSAIEILHGDGGAKVVCVKCKSPSAFVVEPPNGYGWSSTKWRCGPCGTTEQGTPIRKSQRYDFYAFADIMKSSPMDLRCARRMKSADKRIYKTMPAWRKADAVACIRCEAWVGGGCITGDDVRGADIYTSVEIALYKARVSTGEHHVKSHPRRPIRR